MATPRTTDRDDIKAIIREAADRHRIPRRVALAFAWCESRLDPDAKGDLNWSTRDNGRRYQAHVLSAHRLRENPARSDPTVWHSYGLFQLLACYHVRSDEHPSVLYDPMLNADRGCAFIARLLAQVSGNVESARLRYVGLPLESESTATARRETLTRLRQALSRFEDEEEATSHGDE